MTLMDNQTLKVSVTMSTETAQGLHWEGSVEVAGPIDDSIMAQVLALSDELALKAIAQSAPRPRMLPEVLESVEIPKRSRRRRTKAEIEADALAAEQLDEAETAAAGTVDDEEPGITAFRAAQIINRQAEAVQDQAAAQADELEGMAESIEDDELPF
jgi:hypothetical protein